MGVVLGNWGFPVRNLGGFEVFGGFLCSLRANLLVESYEKETTPEGVDNLWISCG